MVSVAAWAELDVLCGEAVENDQGLGWFRKRLRAVVDQHGWVDWGEKQDFDRRALVVYRAINRIHYSGQRLSQLKSANYPLWVYRCHDPLTECAEQHMLFDGLVVPYDHEFWDIWCPPNGYNCSCSITGGRSLRAVGRLGGIAEKAMPEWWDDPTRGPHPFFIGFGRPGLHQIVQAALQDEVI